jgi:hypothetical protein
MVLKALSPSQEHSHNLRLIGMLNNTNARNCNVSGHWYYSAKGVRVTSLFCLSLMELIARIFY